MNCKTNNSKRSRETKTETAKVGKSWTTLIKLFMGFKAKLNAFCRTEKHTLSISQRRENYITTWDERYDSHRTHGAQEVSWNVEEICQDYFQPTLSLRQRHIPYPTNDSWSSHPQKKWVKTTEQGHVVWDMPALGPVKTINGTKPCLLDYLIDVIHGLGSWRGCHLSRSNWTDWYDALT